MTKVEILTIFIYLLKYANSQGCTLPTGPNFGQDLIRVRFNEVDKQSTLDGNPQEYRGWLGISGPESTVTVTLSQKEAPALPEPLEPADYFRIDYYTNEPRTGQTGFFIQLTKSVDRDGKNPDLADDVNSMEYQIACVEDSNPGFINYYLLRVIFEDLNDNSPIFTQTLYSGTVNELTPIGTTIFHSLSYTDLDEGSFGRGDFAILPGDGTEFDGSTKFQIQTSATGEVSVKNVLDFEVLNEAQRPVYSLNVSVSDGGNPRRVSYSTLKLTITDGDDLPPEFVYESCIIDSGVCFNPLYRTSITSGLTTGAISVFPVPAAPNNVATTIQARDQDTMNHTIQFSVLYTEPQGYEGRFSVVTTGPFDNPAGTPSYKSPLYTPQISLVSTINRNDPVLLAAGGQLQVIIKAQEQELNKRFNRAILLVNVNPANSNNPQITGTLTPPFVGYIREDAAVGTLASSQDLSEPMRLIFSDADLTGGLTQDYDITVTPSTIFTVDANGFVRLVANALDYENLRSYTFDVTITERTPERRSGSTSVTINVLDVNDNTPIFLSNNGRYVESISEGFYTVGSPRFITSMSAADADFSTAFNQVSYAIESVEPLPINKFAVSNTGAITLQGTVVEGERYVVTVRASDNGNPSLSNVGVLYLTITSAGNKGPQIREQNYAITVSEGILLNSIVFDLTGEAIPRPTGVTFEIVGYSDAPEYFEIDANTGVITAKKDLRTDPLRQTRYELQVLASYEENNKNLTATVNVMINVCRDDLPPEFVYESCIIDSGVCFNPLYRTYVTSRTSGPLTMYPIPTAPGDATTIIQARNQNYGQNQSIQFSVVYTEPQGYEGRFTVVTTGPFNNPAGTPSYKSPLYTAQISLIRTIDRNDPDLLAAGGQLQVIIKAEEQTSTKRSENAMMLVDMRPFEGEPVLDGNLSPPFTGYIMENSNIGSFVVDINLIKPMRLFITDVTGLAEEEDYDMSIEPYSGIFNIDNDGHIKLASNTIDSEIKKYHNFNVILKKKVDASTQDTVAVRIFILDVNDNSPIFNLHSKSILSKAIPAGDYTKPKFIADVSASDKDVSYSNNRITYQADSVPDSTNKFYVDKYGILYVQGFVNDGESYTIYVSASDNGTPPNRYPCPSRDSSRTFQESLDCHHFLVRDVNNIVELGLIGW